jgi:hypothetical protein
MLGVLHDLLPKGSLVGELSGMAVEVRALPFGNRPVDAPAGREIMAGLASRQHGQSRVADASDEIAVAAAAELDLESRIRLRPGGER